MLRGVGSNSSFRKPRSGCPESISPGTQAAKWIPGSLVALVPRNDGVDGPRTASMCQNEVDEDLKQRGPSMNEISMIGLDLAKNVFQIHGVDVSGAVVL